MPVYTFGEEKLFFLLPLLHSEEISDCSICLPVGPHINLEDCKFMLKNIKLILKKIHEKN